MEIFRTIPLLFIFFSAAEFSFCSASFPADTLTPIISFKHFGEEDGLQCKTVYEALQDKDGFMWFSTDAGVFRYNGKNFKRYSAEDGIADNEVLKIYQDRSGRIWFLTLNGNLSYWKDGRIYNSRNTSFLKNAYTGGSIFSCYEDSRGRLWMGTDKFGFIVIAGDSAATVGFPNIAMYGGIYVHEDSKGDIWTFDRKKMFRYPESKFNDTILLPDNVVNYAACHGKNSADFFFFTPGKVYKIHDRSASMYAVATQVPLSVKVINIVAYGDYLWICTQGNGCYEFVNGSFSRSYFENTAVTFVFRDRENNLWLNTIGEGIYMFPAKNDYITNYNKSSGLSENGIISIAKGTNAELWLGYSSGQVDKVVKNRVKTFACNKPGDRSFSRVICLLADSNSMLCGTDRGVYSVTNEKIKLVSSKNLSVERDHNQYAVKYLFKGNNGNIFAAHAVGLVTLCRDVNGAYVDYNKTMARIYAITEYKNHLLLSVTGGLMEYMPKQTPVEYKTEIDFSSIRALDMKTDKDGLLILASNGNGTYIIKDKKLYQHLSTANGLSGNNCKRISISGDSMYISTDNGINILVKRNNYWNVSEVISTANGLLSNNISEVALGDGKIYAATEKGLSVIDPSAASSHGFAGKVYITEVVTDSVNVVSGNRFSFRADVPRLLIRFAYPVFNPLNNVTLKYRLVQNKSDAREWITSGNNEVEFSSLSPGQYIFQVKPDLKSMNTAAITNLNFEITPLWWQTNMTRVIFVLLTLSLVVMIVRRRIQLQYKKQVAELRQLTILETERNRIASDMHDDIGADLTQISIWSNILKSSENKDKNVLSRITQSSNEVLQKMEQIIWALNSFHNQTTDLISYLREYASQYLESAGINLLFEVSGDVPELEVSAIQKRNVFLTIKELLHNTVKHSGAKKVSIKIYVTESILNIDYKDDGKGFTPREKKDGMGNLTVQKRMKEINSMISVKSNPGEGFTAQLKIKLNDRHTRTRITV